MYLRLAFLFLVLRTEEGLAPYALVLCALSSCLFGPDSELQMYTGHGMAIRPLAVSVPACAQAAVAGQRCIPGLSYPDVSVGRP